MLRGMALFDRKLWSDAILKTYGREPIMGGPRGRALTPQDVWAPTGENFSEAVAWAKLLGVGVTHTHAANPLGAIVLSRPGFVPGMWSLCAPAELIEVIKNYAASTDKFAGDTVSFAQRWTHKVG